jgi:hypothetical protein
MNRYVVFAFSNGEFGSSMPGATSLLATPAILALESVVPHGESWHSNRGASDQAP